MKKHYDKIFLVVALVVAGASAGYFLTSEGALNDARQKYEDTIKKPFAGEKWQEVKVEPLTLATATWPEAKAQDEDGLWLYQIFTPPKIWVDDDGEFSADPPIPRDNLRSVYGFKYSGVKNDPYQVQFKGYFIDPEGEVVVQLYDESRTVALRGKIDEEIVYRRADGKQAKAGIVVKKFDRKTERQQNGTIRNVISISLFDETLGREIVINNTEPTYIEENREMVLVADDKSGTAWEIKKVGDKFEADGGVVFTVKELDFAGESVLVEKVSPRQNNPNPIVTLIKFSKDSSPSIIKL